MENLLSPHIECTDPSTLQFCLALSDTEFWYCQINDSNENLLPDSNSNAKFLFEQFRHCPKDMIRLATIVHEVREFISDKRLWYSDAFDVGDITQKEKEDLSISYGYSWNSFDSDRERNQLICESYFETYLTDFENY